MDYLRKFDPSLNKKRQEDQNNTNDLDYLKLLDMAFSNFNNNFNNIDVNKGQKIKIHSPNILKDGSTHIIWTNFLDNCKSINREPKDVMEFIKKELFTEASVGTDHLKIRGRYNAHQIESIFKKYIIEFVTCNTCKNITTKLVKQNRILFKECSSCGASNSIIYEHK